MADDNIYMKRFQTALDLFQAGVDLQRQNLRRRFPDAGEEEIERRLNAWLSERPGAELGDAEGRDCTKKWLDRIRS